MLTIPPSVQIYLAAGATDLRRSIDGLRAHVEQVLKGDAFGGHLFVFRNRRGDRLKILLWDRSGFWVMYKRLEKGTFAWPGRGQAAVEIRPTELMLLLSGVDPTRVKRRRWYDRAA